MNITSKEVLIKTLKEQIATRDNQAVKALITVFNNQTSVEQDNDCTDCYNGVGFTGVDAEFMSSLAKQYLKKGYLSENQISYVKKTMPKYARQLIEQSLAQGKIVKDGKNYTWQNEKPQTEVSTSEIVEDNIYNRILNGQETDEDVKQFYAMCQEYSDIYKDIYGIRPRDPMTMCVNGYSGNPDINEFRELLKNGINPLADLDRAYEEAIA